jgi:CheY-like chemotaxis protein
VALRFDLVDTGIGVPRELHSKIFETFSQADVSDSRSFEGAGLGLSISRELCRLMGGDIGVISDGHTGSTFWFTIRVGLPASPNAIGDAAVNPKLPDSDDAITPGSHFGAKVLLVDDNAVNLMMAEAMLQRLGCTVRTATDGVEAVGAFGSELFDLVCMDVQMPKMGGLEATHAIRQLEQGRANRTPIVAMTAAAATRDRDLCLDAGMDDFISKPFDLKTIRSVVSKWYVTAV